MNEQSGFQRFLSGAAGFLPHLLMSYSWMILTFAVINVVNDSMGFLSSGTSRHFELVYFVTAVLVAVTAFVQKHARILAGVTLAAGIAFIVPVIDALSKDSPVPLTTSYFNIISAVFGVLTLAFSVTMMVLQRKALKQAAA